MTEERIADWLADLMSFGDDSAYLVSQGKEGYLADTPHGRLLRNAGERLLIKVATAVERLPQEFKAGYPDVEWNAIQRMRNLVAHQCALVNHDLMWVTLQRDIPALIDRLR